MSIYSQVNLFGTDDEFRIKKIKEHSPNTIVDLGCGNGRMTFPMSGFVSRILAIDPDPTAISEAMELDHDKRINWVVGDSQQITNTNVDAITMFTNVSQEIVDETNWRQTLTDCHNALKEDGVLIFDGRNLYQKGWMNWTKEKTLQGVQLDDGSEAEFWHEVYKIDGSIVKFHTHIVSKTSNEVYDSTLIFRTKDETIEQLQSIGFNKIEVYGDWQDTRGTDQHKEFLFIAHK